ncbi:hypothetical protein Dimus_024564 [Dionaea muscipula]
MGSVVRTMQSELGKLFIGGISSETDQDRLREYFSTLGDVGCSGRCDYEGSDNWLCWGIWVCGICWPRKVHVAYDKKSESNFTIF